MMKEPLLSCATSAERIKPNLPAEARTLYELLAGRLAPDFLAVFEITHMDYETNNWL